jgi:hypothetical protein
MYSSTSKLLNKAAFLFAFIFYLVAQSFAQAPLVSLQNGKLVYNKYANRGQSNEENIIPDYSYAGYMGGGVALPDAPPVKATISNPGNTNEDYRSRIQAAIDQVSAMPLDANGFRGTVLIKAGVYKVNGPLSIRTGGVVLRGEGNGLDGTVLIDTRPDQHTFITIEGSGSGNGGVSSTRVNITNNYVPSGTRTFDVENHTFAVGDNVIVQEIPNQAWIDAMGMGAAWWEPHQYNLFFERKITAIDGNKITIDIPLVDPIEKIYGQAVIYKTNITNGRIKKTAVENLRCESIFNSDEDENHGWHTIEVKRAENCWVRDVVSKFFGQGCVNIGNWSRFITVQDCAMIDPKSITTGGRKYSFGLEEDCSSILFQRCMTWGGRHDFVSGSRVPGPNVFLDCATEEAFADIGPHMRYATGQLYDNIYGGGMRVHNRGTSAGTGFGDPGHGWVAAQTMFYNCVSTEDELKVDSPPTARNFGIGCKGTSQNGGGYWESWGTHVLPRSLYLQQLEDRLGIQAVQAIATPDQLQGTLREKLLARINQIGSEEAVISPPEDESANVNADITDNGGVVSVEYNTSNVAGLIDNNPVSKYYKSNVTAFWVQYRSPAKAIVVKYTITSGNDLPERDPKDWILQGSNTAAGWVDLDTVMGETFASRLLKKTYTINNNTAYRYYRLKVLSNNGSTGSQIGEWELFQRRKQVITLSNIENKILADSAFTIQVSANSGLPVALQLIAGPGTLDSAGVYTIGGLGQVTVRATQLGNDDFFPYTGDFAFEIRSERLEEDLPLDQNIVWDLTDNGGTLTAQFPTSNLPGLIDNNSTNKYYRSGQKALWLQYQSSVSAIVTKYTLTSGNDLPERDPKDWNLQGSNDGVNWTLLDTRAGEVFAARRQLKTYELANTSPYVYYRLNVIANNGSTGTQIAEWELFQRRNQSIQIKSIPARTFGDTPFPILTSSTSGLPLSFEVVSGPANAEGNILTLTGAGTVSIRAKQAGTDQYFPTSQESSFIVKKANQTISFDTIGTKTFGDPAFTLSASASSGSPVSFEVVSGPINVSGSTVTINGAGTAVVRGIVQGSENYNAASAEQTFTINKADQVINFAQIEAKTYGDEAFGLTATSSAGTPVSFEVVSGPVSISGSTVTIGGAGTAVVRAVVQGNENYNPASAEQSFVINKATQTISFAALTPTNKSETIQLTATSSSGLPVSYQVISGPGVLSGSILSFVGEGEVSLVATQAGNENYLAAVDVSRTVLIFGDDQKHDGIRLKVYPNPTAGLLKIKLENKKDKDYTFTIFNSNGHVIQSTVLARSHKMFEVDFNLENAESGFYYLHVFDGTEKIVRTIIKQ